MVAVGWMVLLTIVATLPAFLLGALLHPDRISDWASALWERHGRHRRPQASGPPVEQLAVELRRLSGVLVDSGPVSSVRRFGVERAYDETLAKACQALGVEHHLDDVRLADREFERLRVEGLLQEAGLVLRGPAPGCVRHPHRRRDEWGGDRWGEDS
jgi:hypothetical protein